MSKCATSGLALRAANPREKSSTCTRHYNQGSLLQFVRAPVPFELGEGLNYVCKDERTLSLLVLFCQPARRGLSFAAWAAAQAPGGSNEQTDQRVT